ASFASARRLANPALYDCQSPCAKLSRSLLVAHREAAMRASLPCSAANFPRYSPSRYGALVTRSALDDVRVALCTVIADAVITNSASALKASFFMFSLSRFFLIQVAYWD